LFNLLSKGHLHKSDRRTMSGSSHSQTVMMAAIAQIVHCRFAAPGRLSCEPSTGSASLLKALSRRLHDTLGEETLCRARA